MRGQMESSQRTQQSERQNDTRNEQAASYFDLFDILPRCVPLIHDHGAEPSWRCAMIACNIACIALGNVNRTLTELIETRASLWERESAFRLNIIAHR